MEEAVKQYARRGLLIHVLLLAVVIVGVVVAARGIYASARTEAERQLKTRQSLLAGQTARGIEGFFQAIVNNLSILAAMPVPETARPVEALIWQQLSTQVSDLIVYDRAQGDVRSVGSQNTSDEADRLLERHRDWLSQVTSATVSQFEQIGLSGITLVAVPSHDQQHLVVAVVPVRELAQRFLDEVNAQATSGATLLDETLATMATSREKMVGANLLHMEDDNLREQAAQVLTAGKSATVIVNRPINWAGQTFEPGVISIEPVNILGKRWWVYIATSMQEIEAVTRQAVRNALIWGAAVIICVTGVISSTAIQGVRGQLRLEQVRREMLTRQIDDARQIQLAWLPTSSAHCKHIDIAAANHPASHISGDFYDWFELEDCRTVVTIGDVTGHGMSAAFLMATTQLLVRNTMPRVRDPGNCLREVNRQLTSMVFSGQFVTMTILVIDVGRGTVEIASAGHPPPLVGHGEAFDELSVEAQLVLGVAPDLDYPTTVVQLQPRSLLLLYTDGVVDALSPTGERFSAEKLRRGMYGQFDSASALLSAATAVVDEFRGGEALPDDLTLVAVQLQSPVTLAQT